jgi:hypothetical protein
VLHSGGVLSWAVGLAAAALSIGGDQLVLVTFYPALLVMSEVVCLSKDFSQTI